MNREQILAMGPGQQTNIFIHMRLMGNRAWGHHRGSGNDKYVFVQFAPEQPKRKGVAFWEMVLEDIDYHTMVVADVPDYTGDIAAAWKVFLVVDHEESRSSVIHGPYGEWICHIGVTVGPPCITAPLAICKTSLLSTLDPRGGEAV